LFQTTRRRLALWYTIVTAILLLLLATGMYFYVRHTLIERIDDTLKHIIEVVDRSLVIESVPASKGSYRVSVEESFRSKVDSVEDDHIDLEWFSPNGELLWSTFSEPLNIPLHPHKGETVYLSENHLLRQVTKRIDFGRYALGFLRVSHPWFEVTKPIRQLMVDLSIGVSSMIVCVAGIGWLLSGIAIKPVKDSYQSLKQFTADASHELRNPIAMIQMNVQMALSYSNAEPQLQQRQLKVIERLTQRLGHLVNDLLFLARSDSGIAKMNMQDVPLDALLIEVIEEQRAISEQKNIFLSLQIANFNVSQEEIELESFEDMFTIKGDWEQLARLFTNLISNAIEYTSQNIDNTSQACVEVILQYKAFKKERHSYLEVQVKDTGIGIPETALPFIFDRFYRVDPSRSSSQQIDPKDNSIIRRTGSGLGLAIAKAIVENHHGQITVKSVLNQGTIFTIILPGVS
jgi:OmpR-family two-component system manganese-sensing sensor histidine kinase